MSSALALAAPRPSPDLLPRCLLLAALLHLWLALMVGTRPGEQAQGSSWGKLTVTLRGAAGMGREGSTLPTPTWRDEGPPGEAASPRHGGRLRREAPPPEAGPGAQTLGRWKPEELPPDPSRPELDTAGSLGQGGVQPAQPLPQAATPPAPSPAPRLATPEPPVTRRAEALPALPTPALPTAELQPLPSRVDMPRPQLSLPQALPAPQTQGLPAPPPSLQATELRPLDTQIALPPPRLALPAEVPARSRPTEALPRASALQPDRGELAPLASRIELPAEPDPAPALRTLGAPRLERPRERGEVLAAPQAARQSEPLAPLSRELPAIDPAAVGLDGSVPGTRTDRAAQPAAPLTRGDPLADPLPGPRASAGSPDAGAAVGRDVATAPSAAASAPLRPLQRPLDLSLPQRGPQAARRGPGALELLTAPPERKSKLEKAVEDAEREDCRKAHGDKGLLGAVPLAVDALRGKGCKW